MKTLVALVVIAVGALLDNYSYALECPKFPEQAKKDWEVKVTAEVAKIGPLKGAELKTTTRNITQDLLGKLPDAGKVYLEQMMFATYCTALRDDKALTDTDKSKRLKEYIGEVSKVTGAQDGAKPKKGKPAPAKKELTPDTKSTLSSPPPEKSSSVTSVGQTGGITAQNVVINVEGKSKPRAITKEQGLKLAKSLPPPTGFQITAACRLMDSESCSYADKLMDVFRDLKWQVGLTNKTFLDDTQSDVVVAFTEDAQIPVANRIMAALNEVGINTGNDPIREGSIGGVQANTLYLIVGAQK